jgi:hypothetical protein
MLINKNKQIIDTLTEVTKSGELVWIEADPNSDKRKHQRDMLALGEDGTKYETQVRFHIVSSVFVLESTPSLWIKNKDLPGGSYYIYGSNDINANLVSLRDAIKERYCSDMNPMIQDLEDQLEQICKGISISTYRDNKINKIID